ncbi:hypothetical protein K6Y74_36285 [Burkholderia cenocepacia]|nr:hypothetical protein [Burkholderia cenocepacia]MCW3588761.1 hypothetical protein [Burkholderia cenocepacia]MCW3633744.1 hypothetical protein [Burkholderia cenocepacia]MCW3648731.1 hypothetical protein [Burkholderia cenocepacia]
MSFWPQTLVDWSQIAAAIGTCGAVIVSLSLANRGIQTKLEAACEVKRGIGAARLHIKFRNVGRDPVYLTGVGGTATDGTEQFERFMTDSGHLILAPGEPDTFAIEKHRTVVQPASGLAKQWTRAWLKDISGKRFYISNSAECLAELWQELDEPNPPGPPRIVIPQ